MRYALRNADAEGKKRDDAIMADDDKELLPQAKDLLPTSTSAFNASGNSAFQTSATARHFMARDLSGSLRYSLSTSPSTVPLQHVVSNSQQAFISIISSWASTKFMQGCAILFPIAITFYVTWWFLAFFDNFFSPLYEKLLGFPVFGLGFVTSMVFIFLIGVFLSTWLGSLFLNFGEWIIVQLPIIKQVYSASKQVSNAVRPDNEAGEAFKECVLIRHPRNGSFAVAFVTGTVTLQVKDQDPAKLYAVYVPTNHVYLGDVLLLSSSDIIHTSLSVAQGMEIVVSMGMAIPGTLVGRLRGAPHPDGVARTPPAAGGLSERGDLHLHHEGRDPVFL